MGKRGARQKPLRRSELDKLMSADLRAVTAQSELIGRYFAQQNGGQ